MKFAHLADCHIGSWRDPLMSNLSTEAFIKAIDRSIDLDVDFILISGDLFNTALPSIDKLKKVVIKLKELADLDIPVYMIAGSHDFSPSGKTMLDVLEGAGLMRNVVKGKVVDKKLQLNFTVDKKTGAKIAGMLGKKGMLEKHYYEDLDLEHLEFESGFKIFMFHTALTELKSKELEKMESSPVSLLPKGFDYYAAGHVHEVIEQDIEEYGKFVYPGPLFPNSFREIEKLKHGGFYIFEDEKPRYEKIILYDVICINLDCTSLAPDEITTKLEKKLDLDVKDKIITIRLRGKLSSGKLSDIKLGDLLKGLYDKGAYFVMKNSSALSTPEFEEIKLREENIDELENSLIKEHLSFSELKSIDEPETITLTKSLMSSFSMESEEGERKVDFQQRVKDETDKILDKLLD